MTQTNDSELKRVLSRIFFQSNGYETKAISIDFATELIREAFAAGEASGIAKREKGI